MEVLVLIDFEGTMADELKIKAGDVVRSVAKAAEDGWLEGELRGVRGIFPANFVKEVPAFLTGDSKREPRSLRKTKRMKQARKCEVVFAYSPVNEDELELVVGETIEIIREIEDGWWMGLRGGKVGAFPSNFVKEVFVVAKEGKHTEVKARPKLTDAMFTKEKIAQKASVRNKGRKAVESCQVLFDYKAKAEDELDLKKGDVVVILKKDSGDDGWWEGELNGRCGYFPDNFVMVIPPVDVLQSGATNPLPVRKVSKKLPEAPAMDKGLPAKNGVKPESKDLRSNPPTKVKLPSFNRRSPPPVKDKPSNLSPNKANGDGPPPSPKPAEDKGAERFEGVDVETEKLSHPTANRAKPPQRRPPSGQAAPAQTPSEAEQTEPEHAKRFQPEKLPVLPKVTESTLPSPAKPDAKPKTPPPVRPAPPKVLVDGRAAGAKEKPTLDSLQAEIRELRMAMELLQTRHDHDMQEVKQELQTERGKQLALQEEVKSLKMRH